MYPFSELMTGNKFVFDGEDNQIKIKTGPTTCKVSGEIHVRCGQTPESTGEVIEELIVDPKRKIIKLLDIQEVAEKVQHSIWEMSVYDDMSYEEALNNVIEKTSLAEGGLSELIHKVAVMIREAIEENK